VSSESTLFFTKMHGLGNDFVVIDEVTPSDRSVPGLLPPKFPEELARKLCDRRFGVGCDQILRLMPAEADHAADARMEILNPDASEAEMCGNGVRAVALYMSRYSSKPKTEYRFETLGGPQIVTILPDGQVRVNMGAPKHADKPETIEALTSKGAESFTFWDVNMGNPHAVSFVMNTDDIKLEDLGAALERHPRFPKRTNVEFVQIFSKSAIRVRVWERGAGVTLACGTGACASAVAAIQAGHTHSEVIVHLPGGDLQIAWAGKGQPVYMTGPAEEVYFGLWPL
jgi:diaminopimelate epimerase